MCFTITTLLTLACCYDLAIARRSYYSKKFDFDDDAEIFFPGNNRHHEVLEGENPSHPFPLPKYEIQPSAEFSYTEHGGAISWPAVFPECDGDKQSPVNIPRYPRLRKPLDPLLFRDYWDNKNTALLNNTGKHAKVTLQGDSKLPTLSGGPLNGEYTFSQLHFHWGSHNSEGSEHTIDLEPFSMEAHVVHYKTEYGSMEEAAKHEDGLAVVAFFLQADKHRQNKAISELVNSLPKVKKALAVVSIPSPAAAFGWFRSQVWGDYATYAGSLTTPPCTEAVRWIVFIHPCFLSSKQVDEFRTLRSVDGSKIKINYRQVQRLLVEDLYGPII